MKLLGFKSLDTLKPYMYVKPGHFIYPDEKVGKFKLLKNRFHDNNKLPLISLSKAAPLCLVLS